jgi:catechol-2,3-dioxygenase
MELNHLHLHVRDRSRAQHFYALWFGMTVQRQSEEITFMVDDRQFLLALMDDPAPTPLPPWFHFGFRMASSEALHSLHDRMRDASIPIPKELYHDASFASYRCGDPDGYLIEVYRDEAAV